MAKLIKTLSLVLILCAFGPAQESQHASRSLTISSQPVQEFSRQSKVALLVGVGNYPEVSGFSQLRFPAQDVAALAQELQDQHYSVITLVDTQATRGVILKYLRNIGEITDSGQATLLVYFSGHGFAQEGANYLAVYGSVADDLTREGLSLDEVLGKLREFSIPRKVLFVDACRNNPLSGRQASGPRSFVSLSRAKGLKVLYATQPGGISFEDDELQHGVFTYYLIQALRGAAAGQDGQITFDDLKRYVTESVQNFGLKHGESQMPFDYSDGSGEFLLARANTETKKPATTTKGADEFSRFALELMAKQMYQEAIGAFDLALNTRPGVAEEYYYRGLAYGHLQHYREAINDFATALQEGGDAAYVFTSRGVAYAASGNYASAMVDFTRALDLKPDYAKAYEGRGRLYLRSNKCDLAIADFTKAIQLQPRSALAYRDRGRCYAQHKQYRLAIEDLNQSISNDAEPAGSYLVRGSIFEDAGDDNKALADYSSAIHNDPQSSGAYEIRSRLYSRHGDYEQALLDCSKAIELNPGQPEAYSVCAYAHAALKHYEAAIEDCSRALAIRPEYVEVLNTRGYSLVALKRYSLALADLTKAIEINPAYREAYENRAAARRGMGDSKGAAADLGLAATLK